ncbi:MAG: sulfotransferase [Actinomycetota bacterium]
MTASERAQGAASAPSPKIFGLGLARTGTTSLHHAMGILGIDSAPSSAHLIDGWDPAFIAAHDAFFDNPIPFLRATIEDQVADARYIVTVRNRASWLASMSWLFGPGLDRLDAPTRALGDRVHRTVYGTDTYDADVLGAVYDRHYHELGRWAYGRHDALWLDVDTGLSWEPLCAFLDRPHPGVSFPHRNRSDLARMRRLRARLRWRPRLPPGPRPR